MTPPATLRGQFANSGMRHGDYRGGWQVSLEPAKRFVKSCLRGGEKENASCKPLLPARAALHFNLTCRN